jgi:signal peptidase I
MRRKVRDGLVILLVTVLGATALRTFVIDAYHIPSASMSDAILPGDFILVDKFVAGLRPPSAMVSIPFPSFSMSSERNIRRGSIIVFTAPAAVERNGRHTLVKRCVGLPGDTIGIADGTLHVNASALNGYDKHFSDPYPDTVVPYAGMTVPLDVPSACRWSEFIRSEGHEVNITGDAVMVDGRRATTYTVNNDYYFVIGDNVGNSEDSRSWGFLPGGNIVGRAMMIYWSRGSGGIRWSRIGTLLF